MNDRTGKTSTPRRASRHRLGTSYGLLLGVWACLFASSAAFAHQPPERFQRLSTQDGLPDNEVHSMLQDQKGFLWFATRDGLGRFDGYGFETYRHDPTDPTSVDGSWIGPMVEDRKGRFWIALGVGGVDRFDPSTGIFEHFDLVPETVATNDSQVSALALDGNGDVWLGTAFNGLFRMRDDQRWQYPVTASDGNGIADLEIDQHGRMWAIVCGRGAGVYVAEEDRVRWLHEDFPKSDPCPRDLQAAADGGMWSAGRTAIDHFTVDPAASGGISRAASGGISRAASGGTSGTTGHHRSYSLADLDFAALAAFAAGNSAIAPGPRGAATTLRIGTASHLQTDGDESLWVAIDGFGAVKIDIASGNLQPLPLNFGEGSPSRGRIRFLHLDQQGTLWLGCLGTGLFRKDPNRQHFDHYQHHPDDLNSLSSNRLSQVFEDRSGALWFGTFDQGVSLVARSRWKFRSLTHNGDRTGLSQKLVSSLAEDSTGRIWLGSFAGVDIFDRQTQTVRHIASNTRGLQAGGVTAIQRDGRGQMWVGGLRGLRRYEPQSDSFVRQDSDPARADTLSSHRITVLAAGHRNPEDLWVANAGTVDRVNVDTGKVERLLLSFGSGPNRPAIWCLLEDAAGHLWIGMPSLALYRYNIDSGQLDQFTRTSQVGSLNNRTVNSLFLDRHERLWVGTYSGGLGLYDADTETFRHFTVHDGLPSNMIESIVAESPDPQDELALWLSTNRGLARFVPETSKVRVYDRRDGLAVEAFGTVDGLRTQDGEFWFGGRGGAVAFRTNEIVDNPSPPPVVLTGLRKFGRRVELEKSISDLDEIVLSYRDQVFGFVFTALDYADPSKNRYLYKLEGFDRDWIDAGTERTATYTNIDPGNYTFRVRGSNHDGVWNEEGTSIQLRILPPFWDTWWFRLLQLLGFMLLIVTGLKWQERRVAQNQRREQGRRELASKTRELELARKVQSSMLPSDDLLADRFEAVGRLHAATEVAGDYYDFLEVGDGSADAAPRYCIALGDAIGHGMAAGLVVSMVKAALTEALRTPEPQPDSLLASLDAILRDVVTQHQLGMGMALALLDPETLTVELSSVAMPYPYLWRAQERTLTSFELPGLPLGRWRSTAAPSCTFDLQPGDFLILLSDGFAERQNADDDLWGYDRLEVSIRDQCRRQPSARDLADGLMADCDAFADGLEPTDDITVVVLHARET